MVGGGKGAEVPFLFYIFADGMKKKQTHDDYIKAARRGSREAELELHGHPVPRNRVHKSKKTYDRKKAKAVLNELP